MRNVYKILIILILLISQKSYTQDISADSLMTIIQKGNTEQKIDAYISLSQEIGETSPAKSLEFAQNAYNLSEKTKISGFLQIRLCRALGAAWQYNKNYRKSLRFYKMEYDLLKKIGDEDGIMEVFYNIGIVSENIRFGENPVDYFNQSLELARKLYSDNLILLNYKALYDYHSRAGNIDEAIIFYDLYNDYNDSLTQIRRSTEIAVLEQMQTEIQKGKKTERILKDSTRSIAQSYEKQIEQVSTDKQRVIENLNRDKEYLQHDKELKEKMLELKEQKVAEQEKLLYLIIGILVLAATVIFLLVKLFLQIRANNLKLEKQKKEIERQALEISLKNQILEEKNIEIQNNQQRMIYQEKLSSLGLLTAGIAHEIRNPLNFVNNFARLSNELIDELGDAVKNIPDEGAQNQKAEITEIAEMLNENLTKIVEHGMRAERIIKGMLAHSHGSAAVRESSNLNQIVDEYVKLAYHGVKGEHADFNTEIITNYDTNIGMVMMLPNDFSRVILNIVNNACYAMRKKKLVQNTVYKPKLEVDTKKQNNTVVVTICDNGTGMPEKVINQIFNPFFTTKPTGEGTGLGLSMSYDIITNGHNGKIEVDSKDNEFTRFTISIPVEEKK